MNGIIVQTSCVGISQQNGRVKWKHRHILNVGRALSLRVFGTLCFAHNQNGKLDKFNSHSSRCIFVGYSFGKKGWKLFDLESGEYFFSHDVIFYEHEYPFASSEPKPNENVLLPSGVRCVDEGDEEEVELAGGGEAIQPSSDGNGAPRASPPVLVLARSFLAALTSGTKPRLFKEVMKIPQCREAMKKEIEVLEDNRTWSVVQLEETVGHSMGVQDQLEDIFTKALGKQQFDLLLRTLTILDLHAPT
ncbi:hypothetical protein LIER_21295 [Lithospermum erythrorhizon]|uniref:Retroviral polymerase SH3-like domain-containing protein n=1 Tax=Lithospermum erythrorhizon TaxID=34254 RepID=A0AAV3QS65_LITER